jgi:hypothetical protein
MLRNQHQEQLLMTRKILLSCFLILSITVSLRAMKIQGIIINRNDTSSVTFNIPTNARQTEPNFQNMQRSIKYYDINGKKKILKPKDAEEVQFTMNNKLIRILSRKMNFNTNNRSFLDSVMFLKLEEDGYLKLFSFHLLDMNNMNSNKRYLLQKGTDELKWVNNVRIKKDLIEYLSECSSVVEMITEYNFFLKGLNPIVSHYNTNCRKE